MPSFSIGYPERERVEVSLLGAPANPETEGYDWIKALVRVEAGGFSGEAGITMCVGDVSSFRAQLEPVYRNLNGVAELTTIEGQIYVRIEVDRLGHVRATGHLSDELTSGNRLEFEIEYDQTLLRHTISEIEEALSELSQQTA